MKKGLPKPNSTTKGVFVASRVCFPNGQTRVSKEVIKCKRVKHGGGKDAELGSLADIFSRCLDKAT